MCEYIYFCDCALRQLYHPSCINVDLQKITVSKMWHGEPRWLALHTPTAKGLASLPGWGWRSWKLRGAARLKKQKNSGPCWSQVFSPYLKQSCPPALCPQLAPAPPSLDQHLPSWRVRGAEGTGLLWDSCLSGLGKEEEVKVFQRGLGVKGGDPFREYLQKDTLDFRSITNC